MFLHLGEIVEWINTVQFAYVNQAHEHVSNTCTVLPLVKEGILAVEN